MAELSPVLGFLIILKDSFKLILKNVKFIAPITLLSLLLPSILVFLFTYIYQSLDNSINKTILSADSVSSLFPIIAYLPLIFLCRITFVIAFAKIYQICGVATILASATSYTSTQHLYSRIKTVSMRSKLFTFSRSKMFDFGGSTKIVVTTVLMFFIFTAFFSPNPITISIVGVVGISVSVFQLHAMELTHVVSVVEEKYEESEAEERAEKIIEGHRQHSFMINLFLNLLLLIIFVGFWLMRLGAKLWSLNLTEFGLFLVNLMFLKKMYGCVAYTVLYFRCNKSHCE